MVQVTDDAASNGTFLEVALENIAPGESVLAELAHVRSVAGVYQLSVELNERREETGPYV